MGRVYSGLIAAGIALAASGSAADPGAELSALLSKPEVGLEVAVDAAVLTDRDYFAPGQTLADEKRLWLCDFEVIADEDYVDLRLLPGVFDASGPQVAALLEEVRAAGCE